MRPPGMRTTIWTPPLRRRWMRACRSRSRRLAWTPAWSSPSPLRRATVSPTGSSATSRGATRSRSWASPSRSLRACRCTSTTTRATARMTSSSFRTARLTRSAVTRATATARMWWRSWTIPRSTWRSSCRTLRAPPAAWPPSLIFQAQRRTLATRRWCTRSKLRPAPPMGRPPRTSGARTLRGMRRGRTPRPWSAPCSTRSSATASRSHSAPRRGTARATRGSWWRTRATLSSGRALPRTPPGVTLTVSAVWG
mmetsp:Transcript_16637/g.51720  ORF Transcript_16637/g.51720 Transcript_16637/m.51720 type:complete len:253 (-) Transcript_16637:1645-2403(-)